MPLSPEWANLPRRKCDDCGKTYKPIVPMREGERGFCTPNCRKSYHKHGGAYRKLRGEVRKMAEKEFARMEKRLREIVREENARINETSKTETTHQGSRPSSLH
jgi:hypothetical protein